MTASLTMHHVEKIKLGPIQLQSGPDHRAWVRTFKVLAGFGIGAKAYSDKEMKYVPACREWMEFTLFGETRESLMTPEELAAETKPATEGEIAAALDFGKTAEQHIGG